MNQNLVNLIADLKEEETLALVQLLIQGETKPMDILGDARSAMEVVGKRFETGEYFIPDLLMAGEILKGISDIVKPLLEGGQTALKKGKVIIGTVAGDIHDIGKDIVVTMLRGANYEVEDLGVDVAPQRFVEAVKANGATVVGLSGLVTISFDAMKETVAALKAAGLPVKVMIGGGPVNEAVREFAGADAVGMDAQEAVVLCNKWIGA